LDTCASLYKRFGDLYYATERWVLDNNPVLRLKNLENIKVIYYENITKYPREELKEICKFLNISWDESILEEGPTIYDSSINKNGNMNIRREQVSKPIHQNNGKWKEIFSESEAKFVINKTKDLALKIGYSYDYLKID
jgi:hypothetical protein